MPHYEIRFLDGLTPFDTLNLEGITEVLRSDERFENRPMIVRGVNTRESIEDLLG